MALLSVSGQRDINNWPIFCSNVKVSNIVCASAFVAEKTSFEISECPCWDSVFDSVIDEVSWFDCTSLAALLTLEETDYLHNRLVQVPMTWT